MIYNAYAEQKEQICGIRLVSCGHIFAKPGREIFRPKGREDWLLFYVAKEQETFFLPEKTIGEAGSFVLFAPGEPQHHIYEGTKTAEFYYVHFQCEQFPETFQFQSSHVYALPFRQQICTAFEEFLDEVLHKRPSYEKLCIYRLLHLFSLLERDTLRSVDHASGSLDRIAPAVQHMNRFYSQNLALEDYASMCSMSPYHFLRTFKKITGSTPLHYRNNIRLEHAAERLLEESLSAEEIGNQIGYSSASYFSSAFKQRFGLSPQAYRKTR